MPEIFEKPNRSSEVRVPARFASYPAALADWTLAQRADFQVWYATVPVGHAYALETAAIRDLSYELAAKA